MKKIIIICENCGKDHIDYIRKTKNIKHHFCNRKCKGEWMSKNLIGNKHPNYNPIEKLCDYCGNKIKVFKYAAKKFNNHFCGLKCMGKWHSINKRGEKNPMYNKHLSLSEDHRKKISEANKNKIFSNIHKKRITLSKKGKKNIKCSETKKRLYSEGKLMIWNKNKTYLDDPRIFNLNGKSLEPYNMDFNKYFKKSIRERDGCCMLCNIGFEDLHSLKKKVHIHHIDYDKLNSFPQNCITLCNSCHVKTNGNRKQWKLFFQSLLKERYNYEYTEDQKIILDFIKVPNDKY